MSILGVLLPSSCVLRPLLWASREDLLAVALVYFGSDPSFVVGLRPRPTNEGSVLLEESWYLLRRSTVP